MERRSATCTGPRPLLDFIAGDLHASVASAGWLITATQLGYAAGILLVVPLGDVLDRRRLIPAMMLLGTVALLACAVAPSLGILFVAVTLLGFSTVSGQILTPLAGDLAGDSDRGRVVGTVVSGILIGILVSRTISGLVADAAGWRAIFVAAAVIDVVLRRRCTVPSRRSLRRPGSATARCSPLWRRRGAGTGPCAGPWCSEPPLSAASRCSGPR